MIVQQCRKCGGRISAEGEACPKCEIKNAVNRIKDSVKKWPLWVKALVVLFIIGAVSGSGQHENTPYGLAGANKCSVLMAMPAESAEQVHKHVSKALLTELEFFREKLPAPVFNEVAGLAAQAYMDGCFEDTPHDKTESGTPLVSTMNERNNLEHYAALGVYPNGAFRLTVSNNHVTNVYGEATGSDTATHEFQENYERCLLEHIKAEPSIGMHSDYNYFVHYFNQECEREMNAYLHSDYECKQNIDACRSWTLSEPDMAVAKIFANLHKGYATYCLGDKDMDSCTLHAGYSQEQALGEAQPTGTAIATNPLPAPATTTPVNANATTKIILPAPSIHQNDNYQKITINHAPIPNQVIHRQEKPIEPPPLSLQNVFSDSDWKPVHDALLSAYSLGDIKARIFWSGTASHGAVSQSGDGADNDGCRKFKVTSQSIGSSPSEGYVAVCPNGKFE